ncbi:MAG: stage II sporulation protein P [Oscillospiraceae bacterium]|jgi:stage II sporulation protein P|nr:stage II sporulation protein P [Oscillospiraceae bacterium]
MRPIRVVKASRLLWGVAVALLFATILTAWGAHPIPQEEEAAPAFAQALPPAPPRTPPLAPTPAGTPLNMFAPPAQDQPSAQPQDVVEPDERPAAGDIRIEVVRRTPNPIGPKRVLIYHTHTWEAYEPTLAQPYQATEKWRTRDAAHNIVRVGDELTQALIALGMEVVHDTTAHEPPVLATAYTRSLATLEGYRARGETFDYYIDLHRDAYTQSMARTNTVTVDGVELARISVLIGKGTGQTGAGFEQKPNWQVNIQLAQRITDALNGYIPDLARPVITKTGRFNQHISENAVLIEVGNNKNTLEQALAAMPYLARAIVRVAEGGA